MTKHHHQLIAVALASILLVACGKKETDTETAADAIEETQASVPLNTECNPGNNPGIDCGCVTNLVESAWHDDPDLDMAAVLAKPAEEFSQASIDALMDVALEVDSECVDAN